MSLYTLGDSPLTQAEKQVPFSESSLSFEVSNTFIEFILKTIMAFLLLTNKEQNYTDLCVWSWCVGGWRYTCHTRPYSPCQEHSLQLFRSPLPLQMTKHLIWCYKCPAFGAFGKQT